MAFEILWTSVFFKVSMFFFEYLFWELPKVWKLDFWKCLEEVLVFLKAWNVDWKHVFWDLLKVWVSECLKALILNTAPERFRMFESLLFERDIREFFKVRKFEIWNCLLGVFERLAFWKFDLLAFANVLRALSTVWKFDFSKCLERVCFKRSNIQTCKLSELHNFKTAKVQRQKFDNPSFQAFNLSDFKLKQFQTFTLGNVS